MKYLLGIDSGGTVVKAGLYDVEGRETAIAQEGLDIIFPSEGLNERDVNQLKDATYGVVRGVIGKAGIDSADIAGISVTGQGNGLYLFDENGNSTHNPVLSGDMRAKEYVKKWIADGTVEKVLLPRTCQDVWAGQPVALLAWFRDHEPQTLERSKYAVTCKDYTRYLLTGKFNCEMTEASGWNLMDIRKGEFDAEIFAAAGLGQYKRLFPPLVESTEVAGNVTKEAAALTGLAEGTPVTGGMFDITACPFGTGVLDSSKLGIVVGSWGMNVYIDTQPTPDIFMSSRYILPGYYQLSEGSSTSATNLEWFINRFMQAEKAEEKAAGRSVYGLINEMVASVDTRDCPIIFLPFLFGTNANIDAKSAFIGLSGIHTKAHMLRAVYEGIVFCHQYHLEKLYKCRPKENFDGVRISGGGTNSELWVQMFADIIGIPMEVSSVTELGTMGAAMAAGVGVGEYKDCYAAAETFVRIKKAVQPNPEIMPFYEKKYQLYKKVLDSLDGAWGDFDALNR